MRFTNHLMFATLLAVTSSTHASPQVFEIQIKDHKFNPEIITVPVGVKIKLNITNADPTPEEFESYKLNREKIISGNSKAIVFIGPLDAGEYDFFGEFNPSTAQGKIIAK